MKAITHLLDHWISEHGLEMFLWSIYAAEIFMGVVVVRAIIRRFKARRAKVERFRAAQPPIRTQQRQQTVLVPTVFLPFVPDAPQEKRARDSNSDDSESMAFPI